MTNAFDKEFGKESQSTSSLDLYDFYEINLSGIYEDIKAFISQHYLLKTEVKKQIEGMKKEAHVCMCNDDDCLIECNESYNNALADLLTLLKLEE